MTFAPGGGGGNGGRRAGSRPATRLPVGLREHVANAGSDRPARPAHAREIDVEPRAPAGGPAGRRAARPAGGCGRRGGARRGARAQPLPDCGRGRRAARAVASCDVSISARTAPTATVSPSRAENLRDDARRRRRNLDVDLVGRHFDEGIALGDEVADALAPLDDRAFGNRLPHLGKRYTYYRVCYEFAQSILILYSKRPQAYDLTYQPPFALAFLPHGTNPRSIPSPPERRVAKVTTSLVTRFIRTIKTGAYPLQIRKNEAYRQLRY